VSESKFTAEMRAAAKRRCEAATPGRWERYGYIVTGSLTLVRAVTSVIRPGRPVYRTIPSTEADSMFLVHAREDILAAMAEIERLEAATANLSWRPRNEHGGTFSDGEQMLVAVPCCDHGDRAKRWWEVVVIVARCDEDEDGDVRCEFELDGNPWGWEWEDVEWWMPMSDIKAGLPDVREAADAAGGE